MTVHSLTKALKESFPNQPVDDQHSANAFHNLTGFMSVLIRVNEREQIVPTKNNGRTNENQ